MGSRVFEVHTCWQHHEIIVNARSAGAVNFLSGYTFSDTVNELYLQKVVEGVLPDLCRMTALKQKYEEKSEISTN